MTGSTISARSAKASLGVTSDWQALGEMSQREMGQRDEFMISNEGGWSDQRGLE